MIHEDSVLCQSGVGERIWALYHADPDAFKREVKAYFERGYPNWKVVKASYKERIIWIQRI